MAGRRLARPRRVAQAHAEGAATVLALIPALLVWTRRVPLQWDGIGRRLALHLLGSVVFSLVHVAGMVALRKLAYGMQGADYDFGVWPTELFYEYLKDVRSYAVIVAVIERPEGFGHCPHLDDPEALAARIAAFARTVSRG